MKRIICWMKRIICWLFLHDLTYFRPYRLDCGRCADRTSICDRCGRRETRRYYTDQFGCQRHGFLALQLKSAVSCPRDGARIENIAISKDARP